MIRIHDISTNEIVDREMNDQEFAAYLADKALVEAEEQAKADIIAAKESAQAKLAALGITTEDLKALGL